MDPKVFSTDAPGMLVPTVKRAMAFVPNRLPPSLTLTSEIQEANDRAMLALGKLEATVSSLPNRNLATSPLMRREAVLSSKIEGTHTEVAELYRYEAEGGVDETGPERQDAKEVLNYVRALTAGLERLKEIPICGRLIREMHKALMAHVRGSEKQPGEFRLVQNFIGAMTVIDDVSSVRFTPPPPDRVESLMADLERYINAPQDALPKLIRVALVHYQFETIHPFCDGNGRLGRLLIALMLCQNQVLTGPFLYISAYFERHRTEYVDRMLDVSTKGDWNAWILLFLDAVYTEADDTARRIRSLLRLREAMRGTFQTKRAASASTLRLIDSLFVSPILSVPKAQEILDGMSYNGALKNVEKLIESRYLSPIEVPGRAQWYISQPVVDLLSTAPTQDENG